MPTDPVPTQSDRVLAAVDPAWRTFGEISVRLAMQPIEVRRELEALVTAGRIERRGDDEYRLDDGRWA